MLYFIIPKLATNPKEIFREKEIIYYTATTRNKSLVDVLHKAELLYTHLPIKYDQKEITRFPAFKQVRGLCLHSTKEIKMVL